MDGNNEEYGNCVGPNSMFVKLISSDGHQFIMKRDHVVISRTIESMLSGPSQFSESKTNTITFKEIPSNILRIICLYFTYTAEHKEGSNEIPPFFIPKDFSFDVLMAANFLDL